MTTGTVCIKVTGNSADPLEIKASNDDLCMGEVQLSVAGPLGIYVWTDDRGNEIGIGQHLSVSEGGTYTVYYHGDECFQSASIYISDDSREGLNIIADVSSICEGESAQLCGPEGYSSYTWYGATGSFVLGTDQCLLTTAPGSYTLIAVSYTHLTLPTNREV